MNKQTYHTIIIGATSFGAGLATSLSKEGKKVLIVEALHSTASDFSAPLKGEKCDFTKQNNLLSKFLLTHEIAREDGLWLPQALPCAIANVLSDHSIECLYNCIPTKVTQKADGTFRLSVISRRGALILHANNMVDTTALGSLPTPDGSGFAKKHEYTTALRAVCFGSPTKAPSPFETISIYDDSLFLL